MRLLAVPGERLSSRLWDRALRDQGGSNVFLEPDPDGGYVAVIPALPGCYSQGETVEEALSNARDAIILTIEDMRERGEHEQRSRAPAALARSRVAFRKGGVPNGIRTRVTALKGPCPGPARRWGPVVRGAEHSRKPGS
jgi:predicted RNase H-like HicB family nuclease